MKDKKTIREWEREFELNIVDMDGFDKRDPHLFERLFTKAEFEQAIAFCTVLHKQPGIKTPRSQTYVQNSHRRASKISYKEKYKRNKINMHIQKKWILYVSFPLPAVTSFLLNRFYQFAFYKIRIRWYYPFCMFLLGLCILLLTPVTTSVAGPLYLWYLIFGFIAQILGSVYFQLITSTLHKGALPPVHNPFLSSMNLFGNPINLYFSLGKAVTSSIVIAILIVCATDLQKRLASTKSAR